MGRPRKTVVVEDTPKTDTVNVPVQDLVAGIAGAVRVAIEEARPSKKNSANRKKNSPWTPKDGGPRLKLKRKFFQHGIQIHEERLTNGQIELINQLKPGVFLNHFKVKRRKDKGIDIDYPIRTAAQRLRLITEFGIRDLTELLSLLVREGKNPTRMIDDDE